MAAPTLMEIDAKLGDIFQKLTDASLKPEERQQLVVARDKLLDAREDIILVNMEGAAANVAAATEAFNAFVKARQGGGGPAPHNGAGQSGTTDSQFASAESSLSLSDSNLTTPNRDMVLLHPIMREAAQKVLAACQAANLPFRIFEAWRSPERQQYLYAQGRTRAGAIVTYAQAWQSYHQYGLAADFVLYRNGQWSWDDSGANEALWDQLHAIGKSFGLEPLGFETPHLQVAGLKSANLLEGILPDGGDGSWKTNLAGAVDRWTGLPAGPPPFENNQVRPALSTGAIDSSKAPAMDSSDWHSLFGGQEWRYDAGGVYLRANPGAPCRSAGAPATAQSIIGIYGAEIFEASIAHNVPPELIVMTIATETGAQRNAKYTGPLTFRWEPAVRVNDVTPPAFGDYSAGPMQTLATSAREVSRNLNLSKYQPMQTAPYIAVKPDPAPPANPLYDGATNIDIGTAEIRSRINKSKIDPILVAACFNAGGLYQSDQTVWRIRSYGDHLDRASQWFGDACFVLSTLRAKA